MIDFSLEKKYKDVFYQIFKEAVIPTFTNLFER